MSETSRFIGPILNWLFPNEDQATITTYHGYIRKLAHLTEYGILASLAAIFFRSLGRGVLQKAWVIASLAIVLIIATADESIQSFDPSRTGTPRDVALDFSGGLIAVLIICFALRLRKN